MNTLALDISPNNLASWGIVAFGILLNAGAFTFWVKNATEIKLMGRDMLELKEQIRTHKSAGTEECLQDDRNWPNYDKPVGTLTVNVAANIDSLVSKMKTAREAVDELTASVKALAGCIRRRYLPVPD